MEKRKKVLDSFVKILENSDDPSAIDTFLSLYPAESDASLRLTIPTLSIENETFESKRKGTERTLPMNIVSCFLRRGNPFPPATTKTKDKSTLHLSSENKIKEHDEERKKQQDTVLENMETPYNIQYILEANDNESIKKRHDFKNELLGAIGKQNKNLNQTVLQLCITRITTLLSNLIRNSVIANRGVISLDASKFMTGVHPNIIHSEESDHQLVEEQLKDFRPSPTHDSLKTDENANESQSKPVDPVDPADLVVDNLTKIDKFSKSSMYMESMEEGCRPCKKFTMGKSSISFCFEHEILASTEQIHHIERAFEFKGVVELNLINETIPFSFFTSGKLHATYPDSSTSYPKEIIITLSMKYLYDNIIDNFSKALKAVIVEKNKVRPEYISKKVTQSAAKAASTERKRKNSIDKTAESDKRGLKRRSVPRISGNGMYQNQVPPTAMPLRPPYLHSLPGQLPNTFSSYTVHPERRLSGLDSLGEAAEAVWLADEAMARRESFKSQGGRPSYTFPNIDSPNQNFNRGMNHYNDVYSRESSNVIRQAFGTNDPYGYSEPRRLTRMSRRLSNDSMAGAIDAVYLAELEADRRQRASLHEAMRLLDATSNRPSVTNTMVAAAAAAARFADMEEIRRQSFLSNDSNELFDLASRHRRSRQFSVDSFSAPMWRRSTGPESILSAAEAVRLADMRRSSGGIGSSMHSAAELVRISDQLNPMNNHGNYHTGIDTNDYGGAYMNSFGGSNINFPTNEMNQVHNDQRASNGREPVHYQQQVHFQNQMGI